jgi:hypothetical protein
LGYMLCWQDGILWLLLSCCKLSSWIFLFEFSVIQGILLTLPLFSFVKMQKRRQSDGIICFGSIYRPKTLWIYRSFRVRFARHLAAAHVLVHPRTPLVFNRFCRLLFATFRLHMLCFREE